MNDATSGNDADADADAESKAVDADRRPAAADDEERIAPFDIDPNAPLIQNIDESVKRAAW